MVSVNQDFESSSAAADSVTNRDERTSQRKSKPGGRATDRGARDAKSGARSEQREGRNEKRAAHTVKRAEQSRQAATRINTVLGRNVLVIAGTLAVFLWAYYPVLVGLVEQWSRIDDYSHGFVVVPVAILMLWIHRDRMPCGSTRFRFLGLILIAFAGLMRWSAAKYFLVPVAGWSIPIWIAGLVLFFYGWNMLRWSMAAIIFLAFMVPLPYFIETAIAGPLQNISAQISCFVLQCFMLPATIDGNTILLGEHSLDVARACSGLRITMGVAALAYVFAVMFRQSVLIRVLMGLAVLPIAIAANALRIVITAAIYNAGCSETFLPVVHDHAGLLMLPLAAGLFFGLVFFLDRLFPRVEEFETSHLVRQRQGVS